MPILSTSVGPEYHFFSFGSESCTKFSPAKPLHGTNHTFDRLKPACFKNGLIDDTINSNRALSQFTVSKHENELRK